MAVSTNSLSSSGTGAKRREPFVKRLARALLPLIVTTIVVPPASVAAPYSAPNPPSLLSQQPDYVASSVDPNVALILDDSRSMEDITLSMPVTLAPGGSPGGTVAVRGKASNYTTTGGWSLGSTALSVDRDLEWLYRTSVFNPLYYDPATQYRPWNDNGRNGAAGRFTNASVGNGALRTNQFREGTTRQDMRYVGPNRSAASSNAAQQADLSTATGANPPDVPDAIGFSTARFTATISGDTMTVTAVNSGVIEPGMALTGPVAANTSITQQLTATPVGSANGGAGTYKVSQTQTVSVGQLIEGKRRVRPSAGGFPGATDTTTVGTVVTVSNQDLFSSLMVKASSNVCPVPPTSALTAERTRVDRNSTPQTVNSRSTDTRPFEAAPTSNRATETRDSFPRGVVPRDIVLRSTQPAADGSATIGARVSAPLNMTPRVITNRTAGATTTTISRLSSRPTAGLSGTTPRFEDTRPNVVRPANFNRNINPRPNSTILTSNRTPTDRLNTAVPATYTRTPTDRPSTPLGAPQDRTITDRPLEWRWETGVCGSFANPIFGPWGTTPPPTGVTCSDPGGETKPAQVESRLQACPAGTTQQGATQCISDCPAGTITSGTQCLAQCVAGTTEIDGRCYSACPSSPAPGTSIHTNPKQCIENCPSATHNASGLQCVGKCNTGELLDSGRCYGACPTGFSYVNASTSTQCISDCTGSTPLVDGLNSNQCVSTQCTGTNQLRDGTTCYSACPGGSSIYLTTQCIQDCNTTTHNTVGTQCIGKCPTTHPTTLAGQPDTCYAACPSISGTASSPIAGNEGVCRTNCPAFTTPTATQCIGGTCTGTVVSGGCYGTCPGGTSIYSGDATQCQLNTCPTGTTTEPTQCVGGGCSSGFTAVGSVCYSNCPGGTSVFAGDNTQCISNCAFGTAENVRTIGGVSTQVCESCPAAATCPAGTNAYVGPFFPGCTNTCWSLTPFAGSTPFTWFSTTYHFSCRIAPGTTTCYGACPSPAVPDPMNPAQCLSCSSGTLEPGSATCTGAVCPSGATLSGSTCYLQCDDPANYDVLNTTQCKRKCPTGPGLASTDTQCLGACPTTHPNLETGTSTTCYANCGNITVDGVSRPSSQVASTGPGFAQCRTDCPSGQSQHPTNPTTQCIADSCTGGATKIGTNCYAATCNPGYELPPGGASTATTCLQTCPSGWETVAPSVGNNGFCKQPCSGDFPTLIGSSCYASCSPLAQDPLDSKKCMQDCPGGAAEVAGTTQCRSCLPGSTLFNGNTQCCASPAAVPNVVSASLLAGKVKSSGGSMSSKPAAATKVGVATALDASPPVFGCPAEIPTGFVCETDKFVPDLTLPALARYYAYAPSVAGCDVLTSTNRVSCLSEPSNYVQVELNRDRKQTMVGGVSTPVTFPKAAGRLDCAGTTCSWDEEAQNFANWYTYYRTRLSAAIAVTSASLSGLTTGANLDRLRIAYGSLNYFPLGFNPYSAAGCDPANSSCRYGATLDKLDGVSNPGHLVRGVRPFSQQINATTGLPANDPFSTNDPRQEVFDWLFSLRAVGATPAREAYDAAGQYFSRADSRGPYIQADGTLKPTDPLLGTEATTVSGRWSSSEASSEHFACRRNYLLMVSDGEWTRVAYNATVPQQPVLANDDTLNYLNADGPSITGKGTYQYKPADEPQFSTNARSSFPGGATNTGGTLSDVALYYWSRDLRPDLANTLEPISPTAGSQGNKAFWQHMTAYLVGYGVTAPMNTEANRSKIAASAQGTAQSVDWPAVRMETRPSEGGSVVTDRDRSPIDCGYSASSNPSGCGRVDDSFRAAMASRGLFLDAPSVETLKQSIVGAFQAIGIVDSSSTSITGASATVSEGDRFFAAGFRTSVWFGRLQSYDAEAYFNSVKNGTVLPTAANARFPVAASRNILTSKDEGAGKGALFDYSTNGMSAAQKLALNNSNANLLAWLRGDHSVEQRFGGDFRNRTDGELLGTIVNSQPIYSRYLDAGYGPGRAPAAASSSTAASAYRTHVQNNRTLRPPRLFLGSNAGMLHAFDAKGSPTTTASDYNANHLKELFAYVPRSVYANSQLARVASPSYTHRYLVDGPIVEGDVYTTVGTDTGWRSVIVGTTGAGPKGVFALDVTLRPSSGTAPVPTFGSSNVLWDITADDTNQGQALDHLGHILQPGVIGSAKDGNWYYFVGNGYESTSEKARLLAINMTTGGVTVVGPATGQTDDGGSDPAATAVANRPNGLGAVTPVYDANRNIVAIYAGDRLGRLWKYDLSATSASSWSGSALFVAHRGTSTTDPTARQPITAAPRVVPHLGGRLIVFGTGKLYDRDDTASSSVDSVYAVWEKSPSSAPSAVIAKTALQELTLEDETVVIAGASKVVRKLVGTANISWAPGSTQDLGWYFDLKVGSGTGGERVIASPTEDFGFVNVTSFLPTADTDPCTGTGKSYFYRLDVTGTFTRPPFTGISASPGSTLPPLSSLVGAELTLPQVSQAPTLRQTNMTGTATATSTTLSESAITGRLGSSATVSSAIGNPCAGNVPGLAPQLSCPQAGSRVWRDLPRGAR